MGDWTFLTRHAQAMLALSKNPEMRLRDVAEAVGVTERSAQTLVNDLVAAGYVKKKRMGRRNTYKIDGRLPMRVKAARHRQVGEFLALFVLPR
jgi:DNA-binding IclR family transcriptional regulator